MAGGCYVCGVRVSVLDNLEITWTSMIKDGCNEYYVPVCPSCQNDQEDFDKYKALERAIDVTGK